ncbi:hypothetical protein PCASD_12688 [Puccinia coronata f. sp. avenae]|uniref:Uncharacterized protein n=1 Tax=Puccinia coronata f. sp. avenae TaxID=200324 RepID=A0A2N5SSP4_9BASI|nr:hypothetical protein PCASD_18106 [Puccinia coronata f. sp. avenae]PLW35953.1 hypothetical protein PCASD_12688 [Puccinia coronata f. sp. avenae]
MRVELTASRSHVWRLAYSRVAPARSGHCQALRSTGLRQAMQADPLAKYLCTPSTPGGRPLASCACLPVPVWSLSSASLPSPAYQALYASGKLVQIGYLPICICVLDSAGASNIQSSESLLTFLDGDLDDNQEDQLVAPYAMDSDVEMIDDPSLKQQRSSGDT